MCILTQLKIGAASSSPPLKKRGKRGFVVLVVDQVTKKYFIRVSKVRKNYPDHSNRGFRANQRITTDGSKVER